MFLDANMSNEVEQKLKENFPISIKREIFKVTSIFKPNKSISKKHVSILIFGDFDKNTLRTHKMALSSCSFPIMPPYFVTQPQERPSLAKI